MSDVRVVTLQQFSYGQPAPAPLSDEDYARMNETAQGRAEAELASLYADGYEITDVTVGGNERVLLTVYTLLPVPDNDPGERYEQVIREHQTTLKKRYNLPDNTYGRVSLSDDEET